MGYGLTAEHSRRRKVRGWLAALVLGAALFGVVWASADAAAATKNGAKSRLASRYVGRVQGSNAYIAVLKQRRKIGGYVCNNGPGGAWLEYTWLRNGRAPLRSGSGEPLGWVTISGESATGTVEVAGRERHFRARRVSGRAAGLFFAVGLRRNRLLVGGWVLLPDGTQRGAVSGVSTRTLNPLATTSAPRLNPDDETVDLGGGGGSPPVVTEPQQLVVINIIAILLALLVPEPSPPHPAPAAAGETR
jgi:hypothetical protein